MAAEAEWIVGPTTNINEVFTLGEQIGEEGAFGHALMATHKLTGEKVAVKVMDKAKLLSSAAEPSQIIESLKNEISTMQAVSHPNIVRMLQVFETETNLYIAMELLNGGNLLEHITKQSNKRYGEDQAAEIIRQVVGAIRHLHAKQIAHCDIKPENLVFADETGSVVKLIDFGMSKFVQRRKYFNLLCGSPYYVAPEVLRGSYTNHCDMWSIGVLIFVLLFGYHPFNGFEVNQIFKAIEKGFNPANFFTTSSPGSPAAKDLISKLLVGDPAKRLSAKEALEHPWLAGTQDLTSFPLLQVVDNLRKLAVNSKLKNKVLKVLTDQLSKDELLSLERTFKELDTNGDGLLSPDELRAALLGERERVGHRRSLSSIDVDHIIAMADADGDGSLSYQELVMSAVQRKLTSKEERLWRAFCKFDLNRDGRISQEELAAVLGMTDESEAAALIREVDVDGNGEIDYEEFINLWSKQMWDDEEALVVPSSDRSSPVCSSSSSESSESSLLSLSSPSTSLESPITTTSLSSSTSTTTTTTLQAPSSSTTVRRPSKIPVYRPQHQRK